MRPILFLLPAVAATALLADDPRAKATDYPADAESPRLAIGAEYLVHSFGNGKQMYFAPDFLVVDTAVYPHEPLLINPGQFALRINGTTVLLPAAPQLVARSLSYSPLTPQARQRPRAPDPNRPDGEADPRSEPAGDVLVRMALQQGTYHSAQGGYLYFAFSGKVKKILSLELLYTGEGGQLTLKLF